MRPFPDVPGSGTQPFQLVQLRDGCLASVGCLFQKIAEETRAQIQELERDGVSIAGFDRVAGALAEDPAAGKSQGLPEGLDRPAMPRFDRAPEDEQIKGGGGHSSAWEGIQKSRW